MPLQSTVKNPATQSLAAESRAASDQRKLQSAVDDAERGIEKGRWVEHSEVEEKLKRWVEGGT